MNPSRMEEWIFFDHPSGYNRIHNAMRWKGENLQLFRSQNENANAAPTSGGLESSPQQ
jgi:STE24 endopeptidase